MPSQADQFCSSIKACKFRSGHVGIISTDLIQSSFYRPSAYAIAQTVVDIPLVLIQVFIFDVVVYFMSNLSRTASQFFISLLILWIITMSMYSFFRALGALCKSLDTATRLTGVAIQALIVYTGYLIPPQKMHPWFKWLIVRHFSGFLPLLLFTLSNNSHMW